MAVVRDLGAYRVRRALRHVAEVTPYSPVRAAELAREAFRAEVAIAVRLKLTEAFAAALANGARRMPRLPPAPRGTYGPKLYWPGEQEDG